MLRDGRTPARVSDTTLEITSDPALLHSEDTVFPLYVDPPTKGIALGDWTALASNGTTAIPRVMSQTVSA